MCEIKKLNKIDNMTNNKDKSKENEGKKQSNNNKRNNNKKNQSKEKKIVSCYPQIRKTKASKKTIEIKDPDRDKE